MKDIHDGFCAENGLIRPMQRAIAACAWHALVAFPYEIGEHTFSKYWVSFLN